MLEIDYSASASSLKSLPDLTASMTSAAPSPIRAAATQYGIVRLALSIGMPNPDPRIRAKALTLCPTPSTTPCYDGSARRERSEFNEGCMAEKPETMTINATKRSVTL